MLNDMLQMYIKAKASNNTKELSKVEKQLRSEERRVGKEC